MSNNTEKTIVSIVLDHSDDLVFLEQVVAVALDEHQLEEDADGKIRSALSILAYLRATAKLPPKAILFIADPKRWWWDSWDDKAFEWSRSMAAKLRVNEHKGGWDKDHPTDLLRRVEEELSELVAAIRSGVPKEAALAEAADVANMVFMAVEQYAYMGMPTDDARFPGGKAGGRLASVDPKPAHRPTALVGDSDGLEQVAILANWIIDHDIRPANGEKPVATAIRLLQQWVAAKASIAHLNAEPDLAVAAAWIAEKFADLEKILVEAFEIQASHNLAMTATRAVNRYKEIKYKHEVLERRLSKFVEECSAALGVDAVEQAVESARVIVRTVNVRPDDDPNRIIDAFLPKLRTLADTRLVGADQRVGSEPSEGAPEDPDDPLTLYDYLGWLRSLHAIEVARLSTPYYEPDTNGRAEALAKLAARVELDDRDGLSGVLNRYGYELTADEKILLQIAAGEIGFDEASQATSTRIRAGDIVIPARARG